MFPANFGASIESTPLLTRSTPVSSAAPAEASHPIQGYGGVICDGIPASSSLQAGTVMVLAGDQPGLPPQLESAGNSLDIPDLKEVHLTNRDGTEWKGTLRQGFPWNGSGTFVSNRGTIKRGTWIDGKVEGDYVEIGKEGRYWIGSFKDGRPWCGQGMYLKRGITENGTWIQGKREGQFTIHICTGKKWEGVCKDDLPWEGKGIFTSSQDGYQEWQEGKVVSGRTSITNPDGSTWTGELHYGRPKTGRGTLWYDVYGNLYTGESRNFKGTYYCPDKMAGCISGTWVEFKRHGEFVIIDSENNVWQGVYAHDATVSGKGKMLRSDYRCWQEGQWISHGRISGLHGPVTITNRNGTTWVGDFRNFEPWNGSGTYCPIWSSEEKTGTWVEGVFQDKDAIRSSQGSAPTAPRRAPRPISSSSATVTGRSTQPRPTAAPRGVPRTPPADPDQGGCIVQ